GEVRRINNAGGCLDTGASGVADKELRDSICFGVTKVNIGTDGRLIWTRVHREFFRDHPAEFNFMLPGEIYMNEYSGFVERKCEPLRSVNMAREASNCSPAVA